MQENDHLTIMFPLNSPHDYVQKIMLKEARKNVDFLVDEQESLKTLRVRRDNLPLETWRMMVKRMVL